MLTYKIIYYKIILTLEIIICIDDIFCNITFTSHINKHMDTQYHHLRVSGHTNESIQLANGEPLTCIENV